MKKSNKIKITIRTKLLVLCVLLLTIPMTFLSFVTYQQSKTSLDELGEINLKNSVNLVVEMIDILNEEVEKGTMTLEEAQEKVRVAILGEMTEDGTRPINKDIFLGDSGYMVIYDQEGYHAAHPFKEGTYEWETEDPNGVKVIQQQIKNGNAGGGFTYFVWPFAGNDNVLEDKVGYALTEPNWNWVVSSTAYMKEFNEPANKVLQLIFIIAAITVAVGVVIIWIFSTKLSRPIGLVTEKMDSLADGDLTGELLETDSTDETGVLAEAINKLQNRLHNIISNISKDSSILTNYSEQFSQSAGEIIVGADQVATTMTELASGAEKQADYTGQLSEAMGQYASKIQETNEYGRNIEKSSHSVIEMTEEGNKLMESSSEQMIRINGIVRDSVEKVTNLSEQAQEISKLVIMIRDISEQTNLLSLNAAIEAARAGEHGKGFAVVADEVRKLAEQVADSVTDITNIVTNIQNEFVVVTDSLQVGYEEVEEGSKQIDLTKTTFTEISSSVNDMVEQIETISMNLVEIAENSNMMNSSIQEIAAISEESAAGIEQTSASVEETNGSMQEIAKGSGELLHLAEDLDGLIRTFKL